MMESAYPAAARLIGRADTTLKKQSRSLLRAKFQSDPECKSNPVMAKPSYLVAFVRHRSSSHIDWDFAGTWSSPVNVFIPLKIEYSGCTF
jgi:hypothetical protein